MTVEEYNDCVKQYADNVYRFVLKNIRDEDKAADIVQDAIVQDAYERMWRHHRNVQPGKGKSYLFSTAYHVLIDHTRREKNSVRIEEADLREYTHSKQYSDLQEILHQALEQLPSDQKMVVMMRDYEGYSYQEIGEMTGLSESQVKVYIYRARVFLRKYIGKMEVVV
ncbi:RNA polymerase sigma factor [Anaerophaga thermohalophila]|jgi:RNA polymerase sigma-70 factor (ECF subfamily)|uniref:RNA polymerase sigma factor n=1 Tax=Anaerophaga thermohalophila TaxID=177400 RepID=UPI00031493C0|nr:RNA polymerase sigma factor [Anaerophaga thermohalophila]